MDNKRSFLRHEVLNIITVMNFLIIESKMPSKEKAQLLEHLKMIQLLCGEQEFILDEKKNYFNQTFDLNELLEMIMHILDSETKKHKVWLTLVEDNLEVTVDRNGLKNGLEQILLALMPLTKEIHLKVSADKNLLNIHYKGEESLKVSDECLLELLKKQHQASEVFLKLAVELMAKNGIKTRFKPNLVEIKFPV